MGRSESRKSTLVVVCKGVLLLSCLATLRSCGCTARGISTETEYANTVHVTSRPGCNDTTECCSLSPPCCSLSWAEKYCVQNSTEVIFIDIDDWYILKNVVDFTGYNNIALKGSGLVNDSVVTQEPTVVKCQSGAGLSFIQSHNIVLENIEFVHCGALQNSTSSNFSIDSQTRLMQVHVGIYFQFCSNINLTLVHVTSSRGTGVAIFASGGMNIIDRCVFDGNSPNNNVQFGGGGLLIEFPACSPKDQTECRVLPYSEYNSDANYEITDCVFEGNTALATKPYIEASYYQFLPPNCEYHSTIGHGAGLSLNFCKASNIRVTIHNSHFDNNSAYYGAGVSCSFEEYSINNTVVITGESVGQNSTCRFSNNRGVYSSDTNNYGAGGGLRVLFWFSSEANHSGNSLEVTRCYFVNNTAYFGGATLIQASPEVVKTDPTNSVFFSDCEWSENSGNVGGVVLITAFNESVRRGALLKPTFKRCNIVNNSGNFVVNYLPVAFVGSVHFVDNRYMPLSTGVLTVDHTTIEFLENCQVNFTHNRALYGGALSLRGHAFLRVFKNTSFLFWKNYAQRDGGAIYQRLSETEVLQNGPCFIQYYDRRVPPQDWNTSFTFNSNRENVRTGNPVCNSVVLGSVIPCIWDGYVYNNSQEKSVLAKTICKDWSKLLHFISTDCNVDGVPIDITQNGTTSYNSTYVDCTNHIYTLPNSLDVAKSSMTVTPGQPAQLGVVLRDDFGRSVSMHSVMNVWTANHTIMNLSLNTFYLTGDSLTMYGDKSTENAKLYMDTLPPRPLFKPISITFSSCPPGFIQGNTSDGFRTCKCETGFKGNVRCNGVEVATLGRGYWIGKMDEGDDYYVLGFTPYIHASNFTGINLPRTHYNESEINRRICAPLNREGILCGRCISGYMPPLHAYSLNKCIKCHNNNTYGWLIIVLLSVLPVTVFLVIVLIFNVSATTGAMNFFVFFAQVITESFAIDANAFLAYYTYNTLYSLWRLEIKFPDVCYNKPLTTPLMFIYYYGQAIYTLVFILIFLLFVKLHDHGIQPFYGCGKWIYNKVRKFQNPWSIQRSVIHALATYLVLSFTKITTTSFIIIAPSKLIKHSGEFVKYVPRYYGDRSSAVYAMSSMVALIFLTVFVIVPMILLVLMPIRSKLGRMVSDRVFRLCRINPQNAKLQIFLQVFQGSFKDGSGSKNEINCEKFAGLYLLLRFIIFMLAALVTSPIFLLGQQILYTLAIVMFAIFQPYRKMIHNIVDILGFFLLATINAITIYNEIIRLLEQPISPIVLAIQYFLVYLPLIIMVAVISVKVIKLCCGRFIKSSLSSWKRQHAGTVTDEEFLAFVSAASTRQKESRYAAIYDI